MLPARNEERYVSRGESAAKPQRQHRIYVADESGKPVEGATVQFCSDSSCLLGKTDAQGLAAFQEPEANYTVHILKAPADYEKNNTEYTLPSTYSDLTIVLKLK